MDFLHHYKIIKLIELQFFGIDLSITNAVITLWLAVLVIFMFFFIASRKPKVIPGKMQNLAEMIIDFADNYILDVFEDKKMRSQWTPFILGLFSIILVTNILGLVPGLFPSTLNINVTASLAILIFISYQIWGMVHLGPAHYIKTFFPKGVAWPVYFILTPIEIMGQLARPFSLAVRLFANIFAGHTMSFIFLSMIFIFKSYYAVPFSLGINLIFALFEVFVAAIQAYIFAYLSAIYIAFAAKTEH